MNNNVDNFKRLLKIANAEKLEIFEGESVSSDIFQDKQATLKCGKYTKSMRDGCFNAAVHDMTKALLSKQVTTKSYAELILRSFNLDVDVDVKTFSIQDLRDAEVLIMEGPTGLTYPFDDLDITQEIIARSVRYNSFEEASLKDFAFVFAFNTNRDGSYTIRGVTKDSYDLALSKYAKINSN